MVRTGLYLPCTLHQSKSNCAELELTTLQIPSAASGVDANGLFERIDFVISDETTHNR